MKRLSRTKKKCDGVEKKGYTYNWKVTIDWEMRPGGMLVQKRDVASGTEPAATNSDTMIKIKVSHASYQHHITVPDQSTFGDLKKVLAHETGLEPKAQRLLFRGKEKGDEECLHMVGVKDMSKLILLEDPASKERKLKEMNRNQSVLKAYEAVATVSAEVDKLRDKVVALDTTVHNCTKVADREFAVLTELLMVQLLKLDTIEADGEAKVQRRVEVRRIQSFLDAIDNLKARNSNPFRNSSNPVSVATKWEKFDLGFGSLSAPSPIG
ncbi:BAG family molecular chaperone regulator 4-like [Cornus florida]|uniref:BAG family molecular chaperone regulator 4-like n=1 Tax=Cornus florida TaxID=4283 RepID=UPI00289B6C5F|nr:BAG family molecular chaperone regulator 4-like [Cornus florida]XP_059660896.1 BAG family molecular chaperone regulator 4-like [Cornus florida]